MDSESIKNAIKVARPRLKVVSPLVAKIVIGFATINLLLGWGLASTQATLATPLLVAPTQVAYQAWGIAFFLLGIAMFITYWRNSWKWMRATFIIGITFKFAWAIALAYRYITGEYSNPTLLFVWLFFAYVQAVTYIHFMPLPVISKGAEDADK